MIVSGGQRRGEWNYGVKLRSQPKNILTGSFEILFSDLFPRFPSNIFPINTGTFMLRKRSNRWREAREILSFTNLQC